jgi:hypothetical protein
MSRDAAIFARFVSQDPLPVPEPEPAPEPGVLALRLASSTREVTALLREASACIAQLRQGRRGAVERLAAVLAQAESAAASQAQSTRAFVFMVA